MRVLCCVPFHPLCWLTKYTVVRTGLSPFTIGMLAIGSGVSQALFHQATSAESLWSGPRTSVIMYLDLLWEL